MAYWLVKSEPDTYSWEDMRTDNVTHWDGVRNFQARNNMRNMQMGDLAFFYHSNKERAIKGIVEICRTFYPDHTDESAKFGMVDVKYLKRLAKDVTLAQIKAHPDLQDIALIKQSRLSVMPITPAHWELILKLGE